MIRLKISKKLKIVSVALLLVLITGFGVLYIRHRSYTSDDEPVKYNKKALMTLTYSGGMCAGPCKHDSFNIYENGDFELHEKLSPSEVAELKVLIKKTDFAAFTERDYSLETPQKKYDPMCPSFVDGFDTVYLFPQKYGSKTFTPCMLNNTAHDEAFMYLETLLNSHQLLGQ